jgi:hypothetical protein
MMVTTKRSAIALLTFTIPLSRSMETPMVTTKWGSAVAAVAIGWAALATPFVASATHGSWHHNMHHSHSGSTHYIRAHASASSGADYLQARAFVRTQSTGAIHGDHTSSCGNCSDTLSLAATHAGGHSHDAWAFLCGEAGSHQLPHDGVTQIGCPINGRADWHAIVD